jgi:hypothetical protein
MKKMMILNTRSVVTTVDMWAARSNVLKVVERHCDGRRYSQDERIVSERAVAEPNPMSGERHRTDRQHLMESVFRPANVACSGSRRGMSGLAMAVQLCACRPLLSLGDGSKMWAMKRPARVFEDPIACCAGYFAGRFILSYLPKL